MTTTAPELADLVVNALVSDDPELAEFRLTGLRAPAMRALILELAQRVPAPASSKDSTLWDACQYAAQTFAISVDELKSTGRKQQVLEARHCALYAGHLLGLPYAHMGRELDLHHTTVMNAVARVGANPRLRGIATRIAGQLGWEREAS